jgi:hypothetical protein
MDHLADDFWHIRGEFRIAHIVNVGTQMSLVRRSTGAFVLLDSYEPDAADQDELLALTDGGLQIDAVLNLHPFHTLHCDFAQQWLPHARLIGTRRHHHHLPHLRWDPALIEDMATHRQFDNTLDFSIPSGVDFISDDEDVHVGSVIARHRASGTVHCDDTLNILDLPSLAQMLVPGPKLRFHPALAKALEKRSGAADDYIGWANALARDWADTRTVCAAHIGVHTLAGETFAEAIAEALDHASDTLDAHRETYG